MKTKHILIRLQNVALLILSLMMVLSPAIADAASAKQGKAASTTQSKKNSKTGKKSSGASKQKSAAAKKQSSSSAKKGKPATKEGNKNLPKESSAELKRRQQSAQAEVKKTQEELRINESEVKRNLNELSRLEDDITVSKKETDALSAEVGKLTGKITGLEASIAKENESLAHLRAEYLKAVKKMRVSKKRNSKMAYLFSANNLAEAERRMRYLKEFSEWKDAQTKEINQRVATLKKENEELRRTRSDKDVMLGREMKAQRKLNEQKERQGVVVAQLKANGDALRAHLAKKQSEVNALKGQVAAVIAEEQRRAEADRARKEAAERAQREAAARKAEEEAARKAEAAAAKAAEEAKREVAQQETAKKETSKKETAKKDVAKKESAKKETVKKETAKKETPQNKETNKKEETKNQNSKGGYAEARKRRPRGDSKKSQDSPKQESPKQETPKYEEPAKPAPAGSGFASMKGSLPRPVDGAFRITGKFGRHALPDLPDVTYDNPGIDIEVAKGASVKSVYEGNVSGVYVVPGFGTVVIVNHGDYYTVYGNLHSGGVKVGDHVRQGQAVGRLEEDPDNPGHSTLHFEVWKGREKTNPQSWIR